MDCRGLRTVSEKGSQQRLSSFSSGSPAWRRCFFMSGCDDAWTKCSRSRNHGSGERARQRGLHRSQRRQRQQLRPPPHGISGGSGGSRRFNLCATGTSRPLNLDWTASQGRGSGAMCQARSFPSPLPLRGAQANRCRGDLECPMCEKTFRKTLDPVAIVQNRRTAGGPQKLGLEKAVARHDGMTAELREKRHAVQASLSELNADFEKIRQHRPLQSAGLCRGGSIERRRLRVTAQAEKRVLRQGNAQVK